MRRKRAFEINLGFTVTATIGYNYEEFDGSEMGLEGMAGDVVPVPSQTLPDVKDGFHVASSGLTGGLVQPESTTTRAVPDGRHTRSITRAISSAKRGSARRRSRSG